MSTRWNDIFQLPNAALAGDKRVPKTMLVQQAALTKREQKTLDKVCMSASLTHKSHAERGATVIEAVESTGLFDGKAAEWQPFLDALAFSNTSQGDLYECLRAIVGNVMLSRAIDALGFYPQARSNNQERILVLVNRYDAVRSEVRQLYEERRGTDLTLSDSAKLRMRIRKAESQRGAIINEIKELCNA